MIPVSFASLPKKFLPHLLGNPKCRTAPAGLLEQLQALPFNALPRFGGKQYLYDAGDWVIKGMRSDGLITTPDTHLYRVRKAEKMRKYVVEKGLQNDFVVPEKYLFWNEVLRQFFVVSKKVPLADEVVTLRDDGLRRVLADAGRQHPDTQSSRLSAGARQRRLTDVQVRALAEMSFLGFTDLTYNNLFFDARGRLVVLDTEPQKRAMNKSKFYQFPLSLFYRKGTVKLMQSLAGTAKLKLMVSPAQSFLIRSIEKNRVLKNTARVAFDIVVSLFAFIALRRGVKSLALKGSVGTVVAIASGVIQALVVLRIFVRAMGVVNSLAVWKFACKIDQKNSLGEGDQSGVFNIHQLELKGFC